MHPFQSLVACSSIADHGALGLSEPACAGQVGTGGVYQPWILDDLFPANVGWRCYRGQGGAEVARAACASRKQQEFVKGRQAAYTALRAVGYVDESIGDRSIVSVHGTAANALAHLTESYLTSVVGKNADRSPRWPNGFVGSIAHSRNWILAAATRSTYITSVGIDTEPIVSAEQALLLKQDIGHAAEWKLLRAVGLSLPVAFTLLFSAKEAFYKCWYPLKGRFLDFPDVIVRNVVPEHRRIDDQVLDQILMGTVALELNGGDVMRMTVRYCITDQDVFTIATTHACDVE